MIKVAAKVFATCLIAWSAVDFVSSTPDMGTHGLSVIGTVGGKTYFHERNSTDWETARDRCEGAGMHMATIKTSAELELLRTFHNMTQNLYYWLGGRDAQTPAQFVWDYDSESLSNTLLTNFTYTPVRTCVAYGIYLPSLAQGFWSFPCTETRMVMCEIIHNKVV